MNRLPVRRTQDLRKGRLSHDAPMTIAQNEIEAKLLAPSREELSNLSLILPRLGRLKGATTCESVRDIYLDTLSRLLLQAGAACRIRQVNGRIFLTLKALTPPRDGICCRRETEERLKTLPRSFPTAVPGGRTRRWLQSLLGRKRLHVLFEVRQERRWWRVCTKDGCCVKVSADISVWRAGRRSATEEASVEIELEKGTAESLRSFVQKLRRLTGFRPGTQSKFQRGLALIGEEIPVLQSDAAALPTRKDPFASAVWRIIQRQLRAFVWHAPGAILGLAPEHLHGLRVASRWLRSALRLCEGALPARTAARLEADLKWLARVTGRARDYDVVLTNWIEKGRKPGEGKDRIREKLLQFLVQDHTKVQQALRDALSSRRFKSLLRYAKRLLKAGPPATVLRREPGSLRASVVAQERLVKVLRRAIQRTRTLKRDSPANDYHRLRIAIKRLRYGLEFFAPVLDSECRSIAKKLARLQDVLGAHHDAAVACVILEETLAKLTTSDVQVLRLQRALRELRKYHAEQEACSRRRFWKLWRKFGKAKLLRQIRRMLE